MLVCTKKHLSPSIPNMITLQKDDYYFYVHRHVYDQAVILSDRYTFDNLKGELKRSTNKDTINWLFGELPEPLNMLSPFLGLVAEGITQDIEKCCGILTALTSQCNLRKLMTMQRAVRDTVEFTLSIEHEYQLAWDRFFTLESVPYNSIQVVTAQPQPQVQQPQVQPQPVSEPIPVDETEDEKYMREENERIRKAMEASKKDDGLDDFLKGVKPKKEEKKPESKVSDEERERVKKRFTI